MPYKMEVGAFLAEWWGFGAFLLGVLVAYVTGKERQQYKVEQLGKDLAALKSDVAKVRKELSDIHQHDGQEAVSSARAITELATDIKYLRKTMDEMRAELRGKADK